MLNINPKEMLCAFPAGVVECQCPCYTASSLEKAGCLFTRHTAFDSPILLFFNKFFFLREKRRGKKETSIFLHWQIETMNKRDNLICSCGKSDSRLRFIQCTPGYK